MVKKKKKKAEAPRQITPVLTILAHATHESGDLWLLLNLDLPQFPYLKNDDNHRLFIGFAMSSQCNEEPSSGQATESAPTNDYHLITANNLKVDS